MESTAQQRVANERGGRLAVVEVEWVGGSLSDGWQRESGIPPLRTLRSVGFLYRQTDEELVLMANLNIRGEKPSLEAVAGILTIPCRAIRNITELWVSPSMQNHECDDECQAEEHRSIRRMLNIKPEPGEECSLCGRKMPLACVTCGVRARDGRHQQCWTCRKGQRDAAG